MDDQNQNPETPQPINPVPQVHLPNMPVLPSQRPQKVIQPSEQMMKEVASNLDSYYHRGPAQNVSPVQNPQPTNPTTEQAQPRATPPSTSNIYPNVDNSHQPWDNTPADDKKDGSKSFNFSNGYSIGGSIFWLQLIAGIVLGLILLGVDASVLKSANTSVHTTVSLLYYLVEFFIVAYIPYNTLKLNNVDDPVWLTVFGVATQAIIIGVLFELVDILIIHTITSHSVSSAAVHVGGTGLVGGAIVVYIVFLIVSYFLTKLSWGLAFSWFDKITNKAVVKTISICVIAVVVGVMTHSVLHSTVGSSIEGSVIGHGYSTHKVTVGGETFTISFDRSAEVKQEDANAIIMSGNELNGSKVIVQLVDLSASPGTFTPPGSCNDAIEGYTVLRNVNILGTSYPLCGSDADPSDENAQANTGVAAVFQANGQWYKLVFTMTSVSQSVDTNTAVQVAQSLTN